MEQVLPHASGYSRMRSEERKNSLKLGFTPPDNFLHDPKGDLVRILAGLALDSFFRLGTVRFCVAIHYVLRVVVIHHFEPIP
jgi:hypothetical protein